MPVTLNKINEGTATVRLLWGNEELSIVYFPCRVSEKSLIHFNMFSGLDETNFAARATAFNETLASLIKSWDLYEDEEQTVMFPLDTERLHELPLLLRIRVYRSVMEDATALSLAGVRPLLTVVRNGNGNGNGKLND